MLQPLLEWAIFLVMVPAISRRHHPSAAIAWLLLIFFKPWMGVIFYLIVGENFITRRRIKSYCQQIREIRSLGLLAVQEPHLFRLPTDPQRLDLVEMTERLVCMPILRGNAVELINDGRQVIQRLIEDIDRARQHVHLLFYIFKDDEVGRSVAEAAARAAARGVQCRVVVDAFGSRSLNRSLGPWMRARGVELNTVMPLNPFRRHMSRIDLRNHRKLVVIDGKLGYTGSQNLEKQRYSRRRPDAWHDLMVRVSGPAVLQLQMIFLEDWYFATNEVLEGVNIFPAPDTLGEVPIQVVPSGPMDSDAALRDILTAAIHRARDRIIITSPYFIPDEPLLVALHLASIRGVTVDLVLPRHTDHPIVGAVARAYFDSMIAAGTNIHFHRGVLHSKTMSIDETLAVIGTANFDHRSFHLHFELSLLLYGPEIARSLRAQQEQYIENSQELDPERWSDRSPLKRIRDDTLKLLSPLL